jgi:predicted transcriptional regulator
MKDEMIEVFNAIKNSPVKNGMHSISYSSISKKTNIQYTMVSSLIRMLLKEKYIQKINNYNSTGGLVSNSYSILKQL